MANREPVDRPDPRDWIETAEGLMRSRFEAFKDGDAAWLLRSWHSSTRPKRLHLTDNPTWRRLQIVETVGGGQNDVSGIVEFRASWSRYTDSVGTRPAGSVGTRPAESGVQHERSNFVREGGRWFYVDGI